MIHLSPFYSIFSFICMFCRSLFVLLYFFFWPLCCLFFFDIRILVAHLVSSNSSSVRLCLQLFVRTSCLIFFICACLRIVVSNSYCVVFFVLCTLCCQFLLIVHFYCPFFIAYSLTLIQ